jgi:hypothetical protein
MVHNRLVEMEANSLAQFHKVLEQSQGQAANNPSNHINHNQPIHTNQNNKQTKQMANTNQIIELKQPTQPNNHSNVAVHPLSLSVCGSLCLVCTLGEGLGL